MFGRLKYIHFLFIVILFAQSPTSYSQNTKKADSLLRELKLAKRDTIIVNTSIELSIVYRDNDPALSLKYASDALNLSQKINFKNGLQNAYVNMGITHLYTGSFDSAIVIANKLIALNTDGKPTNSLGMAYNIKGGSHYRQGNYPIALSNYLKALDIFEKIKSHANMARPLNNLGLIYYEQGEDDKAFKTFLKCIELNLEINNSAGLSRAYNNMGMVHNRLKNTDSSIYYTEKAIEVALRSNDRFILAQSYNNLASDYLEIGQPEKSRKYYEQSLKMRLEMNDEQGITEIYMNLGNFFVKQKNFSRAIQYLNQALELAKKLNIKKEISDISLQLSSAYEALGDINRSFAFYKLYKSYGDSIKNDESIEKMAEMNSKYDADKKDKEILLLNKEKAIKESELHAQRTEAEKRNILLTASSIGFILVLVFAIITLKNYRQKQNANKIIEIQKIQVEEKNKSITDSINYAKRIQDTILPAGNFIGELFEDHFILLKPKDIVSGDFYWSAKLNDYFYLAICDSTGHGVPGSFMSLLNIGFLNEAIKVNNIIEPGKVFDFVRNKLIGTVSTEGQKDGFDGILVCLNLATNKLSYAAANNTPILIKNGQIIDLPKDKMPVGLSTKDNLFNTYTIETDPKDVLYLYTDGFADQFGGAKGKKLMYKPLNQLLVSISESPLSEQKLLLDRYFDDWKGELEQVDDVLVIGIKI